MKRKRKQYSGAFKARVGLEAITGVKTVAQLAREYQVHPMLVSQWKGIVRDRLHELFERGQPASDDIGWPVGDVVIGMLPEAETVRGSGPEPLVIERERDRSKAVPEVGRLAARAPIDVQDPVAAGVVRDGPRILDQ